MPGHVDGARTAAHLAARGGRARLQGLGHAGLRQHKGQCGCCEQPCPDGPTQLWGQDGLLGIGMSSIHCRARSGAQWAACAALSGCSMHPLAHLGAQHGSHSVMRQSVVQEGKERRRAAGRPMKRSPFPHPPQPTRGPRDSQDDLYSFAPESAEPAGVVEDQGNPAGG